MATVYIVERETRGKGLRYSVRCEMPNRPILRLGTFGNEKQAWSRKLAAMDLLSKYPTDHAGYEALSNTNAPAPPPSRTLGEVADSWLGTLHDLAPNTVRAYTISRGHLPDWLCAKDPHAITFDDLQRHATDRSRFKRGTISKEIGVIRQALDLAGVLHNPARGRRIRFPREPQRTYRLPTRAQIEELHRVLPARSKLMTFLEHTGLRIEEAAVLRWSDFDWKRGRFLVPSGKTVNSRRWIEHLPGTPDFPEPPDDGEDGRVFQRPTPSSLTGSLRWAHLNRGTFRMSSHEFRHLHASRLLHERTLSPAQISARLGHANPAITLTTYSHVVPPDD